MTVLVVDDSAVDRQLAGGIVEASLCGPVLYAENGRAALDVIKRTMPSVVLTDMMMPEMDGLELVETVRNRYPLLPVILMTAHGSEEVALEALRRGASFYVPKKNLGIDLIHGLHRVLAAAQGARQRQRLLSCLAHVDCDFVLGTDRDMIAALVNLVQEYLAGMHLGDETDCIRMGIALDEALVNSLYHGNLQVSSELRHQDDRKYFQLIEERCQQVPYRDRRIQVRVQLSASRVVIGIQDEGAGFNPKTLPDPTDPENLERLSGRGLLLIRTFMDEVTFNERGNQITLVKRY